MVSGDYSEAQVSFQRSRLTLPVGAMATGQWPHSGLHKSASPRAPGGEQVRTNFPGGITHFTVQAMFSGSKKELALFANCEYRRLHAREKDNYHMPSSAELVRMTAKIDGSLKGKLVHLEG